MEQNRRYINEIEQDLKALLNGTRGTEQAKQLKILLVELGQYMPYTTTKYLKQFCEDKNKSKFVLRDFFQKASLTTEQVKGQVKQVWTFIKYETEIKRYLTDKNGKCTIAEIKPLKVGKMYLLNIQETYRKVIDRPLTLTN